MKVAVFPSDDGGCGWYRLRWPAQALAAEGHDITVAQKLNAHLLPRTRKNLDTGATYQVETIEHVEVDADVIVFQRCVRDESVAVLAQAKDQGLRVVVDVDDDLDALHEQHPYLEELSTEDDRSAGNLHLACQLADVVTCSTPALVDRYGYGKGVVLPNLVPAAYLSVRARRKGLPRVGWTGRPISHIDDGRLLDGVGKAAAAAGWQFAAWGYSAPETFRQAGVPASARVMVPHRPLRSGYPGSVAELSLGLVPLQDSPFNRAKSWLKGCEYAALGVPFVASDLPEYRKLAGLGAGVVVGPGEWAEAVAGLLGDERRRVEMVEAGRAVMAGLTYEAHAGRWWGAWTGDQRENHGSCATIIGPVEGHSSPALVES